MLTVWGQRLDCGYFKPQTHDLPNYTLDTIGARIVTNTILVVPYCSYSKVPAPSLLQALWAAWQRVATTLAVTRPLKARVGAVVCAALIASGSNYQNYSLAHAP